MSEPARWAERIARYSDHRPDRQTIKQSAMRLGDNMHLRATWPLWVAAAAALAYYPAAWAVSRLGWITVAAVIIWAVVAMLVLVTFDTVTKRGRE